MKEENQIALQNLDCNCNNCKYMVRDFHRQNYWIKCHDTWAYMHFLAIRDKITREIRKKIKQNIRLRNLGYGGLIEKNLVSIKHMAEQKAIMNRKGYQLNKKEVSIQYGECDKFNKDISFIPNVLQLDTQECFKNRKNG